MVRVVDLLAQFRGNLLYIGGSGLAHRHVLLRWAKFSGCRDDRHASATRIIDRDAG